MKDLKNDLKVIFDKNKKEYQSKYNKGETLDATIENLSTYPKIFTNFVDEIINKSNERLDIKESEREDYLKDLILEFNSIATYPFD